MFPRVLGIFGGFQKFLSHGQKVSEAAKGKVQFVVQSTRASQQLPSILRRTYVGKPAVAFNFVKRRNRVCLTPKNKTIL